MKTLFTPTGGQPSREATMQRIGDASGLVPTGADLAVPIASTQDGPRMSGKMSNFGGKKAAPFQKGGKRRGKVLLAKAAVRKAKMDKDGDADMSNVDLSVLTKAERDALPASAFVFPGKRAYPIHDLAHARDALSRSSGKPEAGAVKAAVYSRYPALRKG